jgi:hypothetical protein
MDPQTVVEQLLRLEASYTPVDGAKKLIAYTVRRYLLFAIECGQPGRVLGDPEFQTLFLGARQATDCGWTAGRHASLHKTDVFF